MKAGDEDERAARLPPMTSGEREAVKDAHAAGLSTPKQGVSSVGGKSNSFRRKVNPPVQHQEDMHQRMAALEKLLYDLIVTHSQRERVLINHIGKLQCEMERRSKVFNQTLTEYENRFRQHNKQQQVTVTDNSSWGDAATGPKEAEVISNAESLMESGPSVKSVSTESDVLEEDLQKYDIEYEEVTLDKANSDGNLGLALCCGDENETDVFVEDVDPKSVAGLDGRIRSGDEIIEIDGVDVHTRQQAIQLFAVDKRAVTLVVARPHLKPERDFTSPDSSAEDCKKSIYSTDSSGERTLLTRLQVQSILEEDEDEDEEEESIANDMVDKYELKTTTPENKDGEDESSGVEKDSGVGKTDESIKNEESSEQESFRETNSNDVGTQKKTSKSTKELKRTSTSMNKSEAVEMWVESTASPKHTPGEDLCLEMFLPPPPFTDNESDLISVVSCDNCRRCSCSSFSPSQLKELDRQDQLARAIKLQQQLTGRIHNGTWSHQTQQQISINSSPSRSMKSEPALEWRVKRKPDGTRCIVRRPARVKLLKERATQVAEERSGLTTDDDTMSEFKGGRYWAKEERRKHLERAKARQRHKEELLYARNCSTSVSENSKQKYILEMSRRKMMRVKGQGVLDDFTTVQELMAHGSHSKSDAKIPHRLLAVTTV